MDFQYLFTSLDGRINRAKWWIGAIILGVISIVLGSIIELIFGRGFFGGFLLTLVSLALFFPSYALSAKRFQDRNKPGQTALYGLVPSLIAGLLSGWGLTMSGTDLNMIGWLCVLVNLGVGIWFLIDLGILKGTPGQNQYGGDPLIT